MLEWRHYLMLFLGPALSLLVYKFITNGPLCSTSSKPKLNLAIGILSAPGNVDQRDAIRNTWLADIGDNVKAWFIIGSKDCLVHPDNRIDKYGCIRWNATLTENTSYIQVINTKSSNTVLRKKFKHSINFKVMSDMVVNRLGIISQLISRIPDTGATVVISNRQTDDVLASASFSNTDPGIQDNQFNFQPIRSVTLTKDSECLVEIQGLDIEYVENGNCETEVDDLGGAIFVQDILDKDRTTLSVSMVVSLKIGSDELIRHINEVVGRDEEWQNMLKGVRIQLQNESDYYKDILIVDTVDVYRSLPQKVLLFHKWLYEHMSPEFVLKTDDDCYIFIDKILSHLNNIYNGDERFIWWGNFRTQWLVQVHGKWRELSYTSDVYPAFACGSGNIVNEEIHQWLAVNVNHLHPYQGEDVSMGIWLSPLSPRFIPDDRWHCSYKCSVDMLSIPELKSGEIMNMSKNVLLCGNPCGCES